MNYNFIAAQDVHTIEDLEYAAEQNLSLIHPAWNRPSPARWVFNMPASHALSLLRTGLSIYQKNLVLVNRTVVGKTKTKLNRKESK